MATVYYDYGIFYDNGIRHFCFSRSELGRRIEVYVARLVKWWNREYPAAIAKVFKCVVTRKEYGELETVNDLTWNGLVTEVNRVRNLLVQREQLELDKQKRDVTIYALRKRIALCERRYSDAMLVVDAMTLNSAADRRDSEIKGLKLSNAALRGQITKLRGKPCK